MKLSPISKKIIFYIFSAALIVIVCAFALSLFITPISAFDALVFSTGVVLMSAVNSLKIFLMERTVAKIADMNDPNAGKAYALMQYSFRFFITVLALGSAIAAMYFFTRESPFISILSGQSHTYTPLVLGLVIGLFTMKIGVIAAGRTINSTPVQSGADLDKESVSPHNQNLPD